MWLIIHICVYWWISNHLRRWLWRYSLLIWTCYFLPLVRSFMKAHYLSLRADFQEKQKSQTCNFNWLFREHLIDPTHLMDNYFSCEKPQTNHGGFYCSRNHSTTMLDFTTHLAWQHVIKKKLYFPTEILWWPIPDCWFVMRDKVVIKTKKDCRIHYGGESRQHKDEIKNCF